MSTPLLIVLLLVSPLLVNWLAGKSGFGSLTTKAAGVAGLGIAFLFFALGHFAQTEDMALLLPPFVPFRIELVLATGLLELAIGAALFFPSLRRMAAVAAFAVLVLFFPANVYGALNAVEYGGHAMGLSYLLIRGPLQVLLLGWTWWFGLRRD